MQRFMNVVRTRVVGLRPCHSRYVLVHQQHRCNSSDERADAVGFIGLGNMGAHMARNLYRAGIPLAVYDASADTIKSFVESTKDIEVQCDDKSRAAPTVVGCGSGREVASLARTVITMLPSSPHVQETYQGSDGVLKGAAADSLLIDSSTIEPRVASLVDAAARHVTPFGLVDAPVSGGVGGAAAGTLTFMVGHNEPDVVRAPVMRVLSRMGRNIVWCGASGTGQAAKVCNNLVLGISMIGVSEAMNLGRALGLDGRVLAGIFNTSSARCWASDTYNPVPGVQDGVPAGRGYSGGFGSALMAKDLSLAVAAASHERVPLPLGSQALQLYNLMLQHHYGLKDFSSVYHYLHHASPPAPADPNPTSNKN
jgi:3-hydroxyisobutyrate dehydrogenase